MPKLTGSSFARMPKYRKHRASGQAVVTLSGKDFYLGPHGTAVSRREYDRLVAEWLENGRTLREPAAEASITVTEVVAAYWRFAKTYYVKDGRPRVVKKVERGF